jgi:protein-disulfide isomerase
VSEQHKGKSEEAGSKTWLMVIAAVVVAAVIGGGVYYYRGGFGGSEPTVAKGDPDVSELMQPGALPDVVIGKADAPVTIVEYASMTCPHCAQFQTVVFPQLKAKYIDSGKAKYMLREFPLDNLAVGAFMLARCAGEDRYYPMVDGLFGTQETWAVPGPEAKDKLLLIARQAGFSKERFDQCLGDKELFNKIVETRSRGHDRFAVDSTPTFFVNGKRMKGDHQLKDFDAMFAELGVTAPAATEAPSASEPMPPSAETPQPSAAPSAGERSPSSTETLQPSTETSEPSTPPLASEPTPPSAETPRPSEPPPAAETETNPPAGASPSPEGGMPAPGSNPESNP